MRHFPLFASLGLLLVGCAASGPKEVKIVADENGFTPSTVTVKRGEPLVLVVTRKTDSTCATEAVFAETGKRYDLPKDQPVRIELPTDAAGTLHFACGMDMFRGEIVIE
ncbi:MAG: cupredoxin domain-containing protein [Candidatus Eisenbacteria bacterium]